MADFNLKSGEKASLFIWNYQDIEAYTSQDLPTYDRNNMGAKAFVGWSYFGPSLACDLKRVDPDNNYACVDVQELSPLERQTHLGLNKEDYHRAIIASLEQKPVGILVCQWVKFTSAFWHYHIRYIDVNQDYKNQGIGTELVKTLDTADFLKGKILEHGFFSPEGSEFIEHVMRRELKARDYAEVYDDYYLDQWHKPTSFGFYSSKM